MKEFVEKLIGRLGEKSFQYFNEGYGSESVIKKNLQYQSSTNLQRGV